MRTYDFGNPDASIVLIEPIHTVDGLEHESEIVRDLAGSDFFLRTVKVDWFRDLSPWSAAAVFSNMAFGDGAQDTLKRILTLTGDPGKKYIIGGYSLGGLFALWSAFQTDVFCGVAAVSPSVWFPGFSEYTASGRIRTGRVYLSLGNREEKSRNPVMATVGNRIRELHARLQSQGIPCCMEWNEGNHFMDPELRTAKGFAWVMKELNR